MSPELRRIAMAVQALLLARSSAAALAWRTDDRGALLALERAEAALLYSGSRAAVEAAGARCLAAEQGAVDAAVRATYAAAREAIHCAACAQVDSDSHRTLASLVRVIVLDGAAIARWSGREPEPENSALARASERAIQLRYAMEEP